MSNPLDPFAMYRAFPGSDYYGPPSLPASIRRRRAFPPASARPAGEGTGGKVPTFTWNRSTS